MKSLGAFFLLAVLIAGASFAESPEGSEKPTTIVVEPEKAPEVPPQKTETVAPTAKPEETASKDVFKHPRLGTNFYLPPGFKNVNGVDDDDSVITFIGSGVSITLMAYPIPDGVPYEMMYKSTVPTYQDPGKYQGFQEIGSYANAIGFMAEEKAKIDPSSRHARHLMLWTPTHSYSILIGGPSASMVKNKDAFDKVFASFKLGS